MKTIHAKFLSAIAILSASILLSGANAQTAKTVPVGFMTYSLPVGTTPFGIPLLETSTFAGVNAGITSTTIAASGVNWGADQFAVAGSPFFVLITSGAQTGRVLLVTANTTNVLTLETGDTNLDVPGFSVTPNADTFELFQGDSLGSMFGTVANAGVLPSGLKGAALPFQADGVQIFDGAKFVNYYFSTSAGYWIITGDATLTNQNNIVLYPDRGMLIKRLGTPTTLTVLGRVPSTGLLTKFKSGTSVVAVRFPTDTTLGTLAFSGPGVWVQSNLAFQADRIGIWNGAKWDTYYKNASNIWLQVGGNGSDQTNLVIPSGKAITVTKVGSVTGAATFFSQILPYSLN